MAPASIIQSINQEIILNSSLTANQSVPESCRFTSKMSLKSVTFSPSQLSLFNSRHLPCLWLDNCMNLLTVPPAFSLLLCSNIYWMLEKHGHYGAVCVLGARDKRLRFHPTSQVEFSHQLHASTRINYHPKANHDHVFYTLHFCPTLNLFSDFLFSKPIVTSLLEAMGYFFSQKFHIWS